MHMNNYQLMQDYFSPTMKLVVNNQTSRYAPLQNLTLKAPVAYQVATSSSVKRSLIALIVLLHLLVFTSVTQYYQQHSNALGNVAPMIVSLISVAKNKNVATAEPVAKKQVKIAPKTLANTEEKSSLMANQSIDLTSKTLEPALEKSVNATTAESVKSSDQKAFTEPAFEPPRFNADYLHNPTPEYPGMSRRRGEQGRVTLKVVVNTNGEPESIQLDKSSGFELLDKAAVNAVKNWKFIPAKSNHQSVIGTVIVPVRFSLDS